MASIHTTLRKLASELVSPEDIDRARRVDRGLDNQGRPIIDGRQFFELADANGEIWRIRVSTSGVLTTTKLT